MCIAGHADVVKLLLDHGANPVSVDMVGNSCAHYAAAEDRSDVLEAIWVHITSIAFTVLLN